jgi:hypothetical protein
MTTQITPTEEVSKYICKKCDFNANKNSDWARHLSTVKHKNTTSYNKNTQERPKNVHNNNNYVCDCGKIYNHRASLFNHKKKCVKILPEPDTENFTDTSFLPEDHTEQNIFLKVFDKSPNDLNILTNLVLEVIKSNSELLKQNGEFQKQTTELQKQMIEVCKNGIINNTTINANNTNNSHNKTFNLQFFLNEQCKDAMNIMDFVNTFQLQLSDFERIGEVGYVEGISSIVIDKLNQMDVYKRPIHCSDAKRETMHVKDNDVWVKDASANDKIRLALKHITKKNTDMIRPWINAHPGVLNSEHRLNDKYQEMFIEAMGGRKNKNMKEGEDKIIKKICKMVLIDKNM